MDEMTEKQEEATRIIEAIGTTTLNECYLPVIGSNLQRELFLFLKLNYGKSFTPEYLHINNFKNYSLRQLKYNLTKLTKKEIGVDEECVCIKSSGVIYSNGYYYR